MWRGRSRSLLGSSTVIDFVVAQPEAALGTLLNSITEVEPTVLAISAEAASYLPELKTKTAEPACPPFGKLSSAISSVEIMSLKFIVTLAMVEQPDTLTSQICLYLLPGSIAAEPEFRREKMQN